MSALPYFGLLLALVIQSMVAMDPGGQERRPQRSQSVLQKMRNVIRVADSDPCLELGEQKIQRKNWEEIDEKSALCQAAFDDLMSLPDDLKGPCLGACRAECQLKKKKSGQWFQCTVLKPSYCFCTPSTKPFAFCASNVALEIQRNPDAPAPGRTLYQALSANRRGGGGAN
ncbi:uncharacterized protein [Bemisia tabaci]